MIILQERVENKVNMSEKIKKILDWFDKRIGITNTFLRPIPAYSLEISHWLGAMVLTFFVILVVTGVLLVFYFVPTSALGADGLPKAYSSVKFVDENIPFGLTLRTLHLYSAYGMLITAALHFFRQLISGAYKRPRELMWIVSLILGFIVLAQAFTGYLLPYTAQSVYATQVGYNFALQVPFLGNFIAFIMEGIGNQDIVQRFFILHVFILPGSIILLLAIKLYMFENHGAFDPLRDKRNPKKIKHYPWFPKGAVFVSKWALIHTGIVILFASLIPAKLGEVYDPRAPLADIPLPEWYFYFVYTLIRLRFPDSYVSFMRSLGVQDVASFTTLAILIIVGIYILLLPFIDRRKEVHISKRFKFVLIGNIIVAEAVLYTVIIFLFKLYLDTKGAFGWSFETSTDFTLVTGLSILVAALMFGVTYGIYKMKKWI
ncbi:MAG: cytochrome b N-terminal domain-containing protein [Thermoproteota archaeon]|jgi:quinol-cytochrome oxidoreductase complex cytochrome b subunit|nr:cytochrome b N-terminal domain-containing protein [Thermoproteota archaeon]